jgi:hypothetical protein
MYIISLKHPHFQIDVELANIREAEDFEYAFDTAKGRHAPENFITTYLFSSSYKEFWIWSQEDGKFGPTEVQSVTYPVFFENMTYKISVDFAKDVLRPSLYAKVKSVESLFRIRTTAHDTFATSGHLNFGNEPGKFDLIIDYHFKTVLHSVLFCFEVYPVKLDFKTDFPAILRRIEYIYPRLVIDVLRRTYHQFDVRGEDDSNIVWWTLFINLHNSILRHAKLIVKTPYRKAVMDIKEMKAVNIKKVKGTLADKLARYRDQPNKHFDVKGMTPLENSFENRYVKFILTDILGRYKKIFKEARKDSSINRMTAEYRSQLEFPGDALQALLKDPVFKDVKKHTGRKQRSQVLQRRPGYAGLMKDWETLKKSYTLLNGLYEMELKDIAYLYQIWCFFEMVELLKQITGVSPDIKKMPELRKAGFRLSPDKNMQSKITFRCKDGTLIELYQELRYTNEFDDMDAGTLDQDVCPDIILRVGRKDQPRNLFLTYLFDAKYRLRESNRYDKMDEPLREDLKQMSHYRDVIYNRRMHEDSYEYTKEIMGAFVLFPGTGDAASYEKYYHDVILKTNRGGFPFLPGNTFGAALLERRLRLIIERDAKKELDKVMKQKGMDYKVTDAYVLVTPVKASWHELHDDLVDREAVVYAQKGFDQAVGEWRVRYYAPHFEGKGIPCYYEIIGVNMKAWRDIYPPGHPMFRNDGRKYMVLKLANKEMLDGYVQIKGMTNNNRYTQIKHLYHPVDGFIRTVPKKDVSPVGHR